MRKNSIKNVRLNEEVRKELSFIISREIKDPRIHPMCSVSGVEVAVDLKTAKAYISVLGTAEELDETMQGLESASGYIRRCLAKNLNLRNTPQIIFVPDTSIAYGVDMIGKINALTHETDVEEDHYDEFESNEIG